ncbi:uncharacterized protein LOC144700242 [Wolffia australiana]
MALPLPSSLIMALGLFLLISLSNLPSIRALGVECEELPQELCAYAVSAQSKRCVLESVPRTDGTTEFQCRTSEVRVEKMADWIETDECVNACGVDRGTVGISSDALLDSGFTRKLCSADCYRNCPNIVDLFFNLAAAEGTFLPDICAARRSGVRRSMGEGEMGLAPTAAVSAGKWDSASPASEPAPAPEGF